MTKGLKPKYTRKLLKLNKKANMIEKYGKDITRQFIKEKKCIYNYMKRFFISYFIREIQIKMRSPYTCT